MIEICSVRSGHTHSSGLPKTRFCCHALKTRRSVNSRCCMLHVERCQSWNVGENKGGTPGAGATRLVVIYIYLAIIYIYILYYIYLLFKYIVQCINLFDILYIYVYMFQKRWLLHAVSSSSFPLFHWSPSFPWAQVSQECETRKPYASPWSLAACIIYNSCSWCYDSRFGGWSAIIPICYQVRASIPDMPLQWGSLVHGKSSQQPGLTLSSELKRFTNMRKLYVYKKGIRSSTYPCEIPIM